MAILHIRNYSGKKLVQLIKKEELSRKVQGDSRRQLSCTFWQFFRFCLVGGANTLTDLLAFNILLWCFPTNSVLVLVGYNSVAYASGAGTSFLLNKYWTFKHKQGITRRELVCFAISLCLEIVYSNGLIWLAGKALQPLILNVDLWANASKVVAIVVGGVISYIFMRFWIFASGIAGSTEKDGES